ncbi:GGDEF domain-containing protein [Nannocystaceae bacterium ST9]
MLERGRHRSAIRLAALGLALSPGAPIGLWLLTRWLQPESEIGFALIYSGVATAFAFTLFGGWAGLVMDRLRRAAMHDGLTGLFNRRFLREALPSLQAAAVRRKEPLCLLMLDLDHFKRVNDRHGHLVGDQTLRAVAEVLRSQSRRSDLVARHGGEEFAVLCPTTDGPTGVQVAERLREAIAGLDAESLGHPGPQTVSIGIAVQTDEDFTPEQLMDRADLALYQAKDAGRNRTSLWRESIAQSLDASSSTSRACTPGSTPG